MLKFVADVQERRSGVFWQSRAATAGARRREPRLNAFARSLLDAASADVTLAKPPMTKRNAQDAAVSPDDERPQGSAETRDAAETHGHGAQSAAVRERAIVALLSANTTGAAVSSMTCPD